MSKTFHEAIYSYTIDCNGSIQGDKSRIDDLLSKGWRIVNVFQQSDHHDSYFAAFVTVILRDSDTSQYKPHNS